MEDNKTRVARKKPTKLEEMTKEQIRQAILKKRECNDKAQEIVERLLEYCVPEEYFLNCLPDINQSHFEDIVEERSIAFLCGYPLCSKILKETEIPKQKYKISIKTNKVYDITARKSFCSNTCYKLAMHVKNQLLTSPLWYREYEIIPKFHLLPMDTIGSPGQEVPLSIVEKISLKTEPASSFTSVNDFASASLNDIHPEEDNNTGDSTETKKCKLNIAEKAPQESTNKDSRQSAGVDTGNMTDPCKIPLTPSHQTKNDTNKNKPTKPIRNPMNIVGEIIEKPDTTVDPILTQTQERKGKIKESPKRIAQKKQPAVTILTMEVEKCLSKWFTLDTILYLLGEEKVKEMVSNKGEDIKKYLNNYAKGIFYNSNTYDQYQLLCKKLNMLDLEDKKFDAQTLQRETRPLPDYSIIKEESKKLELKVKAFLSGEMEIPLETGSVTDLSADLESLSLTQLPLVDRNAQNALRRRIVSQHLNKALPDVLHSLGLLSLCLNTEVRLLVNTFKLKANNIMFKPIQWTLIAIVIIKLLSLKDPRLAYLLQQDLTFKHLQLFLLRYNQEGGYLDRLTAWLTDIDRLLDVNDRQLTVG